MSGEYAIRILSPKLCSARARLARGGRGTGFRSAAVILLGALFWMLSFGFVARLLDYLQHVPQLGPLLSDRLLGIVLLSCLGMLLVSSIATALSTFFLARDLDMLMVAPVDWLSLYVAKFTETLVGSSWIVLVIAAPVITAYGTVYHGGWLFAPVVLSALVPFLVIPAALGTTTALLIVQFLPARRTREALGALVAIAVGALVLGVRLLRPERLAGSDGMRSLADFLATLHTPSSPLLPSEWLRSAVTGWLRYTGDGVPFVLLWAAAVVLVVASAALHRRLYQSAYTRAQTSGRSAGSHRRRTLARLLRPLPRSQRELIVKETSTFVRDTAQISQLVLVVLLVCVYLFNFRLLPTASSGMSFFLANIIPFLNLLLAGFVLASVATRVVFPSVSAEGRTWWLLKASPIRMSEILWAKFLVCTLPLLLLGAAMVAATDALLGVGTFMFAVSLATVLLISPAISALAMAFGALFPQFEAENVAQVPTSMGGLMLMFAAMALLLSVVVLEARPVYEYLSAASFGTPLDAGDVALGLAQAGLLCTAVTGIALRSALVHMERLER